MVREVAGSLHEPNNREHVLSEYRIDDLARRTGTTVRSLRVLHDKSLLPPPELRGRTGWYGEAHLARVRLVLRLQERGFTLNAIGELIRAWESGRDLSDVLGLEDALTQPRPDRSPGRTTAAELERQLGGPLRAEQVQRLEEIGILERDAVGGAGGAEKDVAYRVPSPALIAAGVEMVKSGIPLDAVIEISASLRTDMRAVAGRLTDQVAGYLVSDAPGGLPDENVIELVRTIDRLREQARSSVSAWFAIVMDEAVADYVSSISSWARGDEAVGRAGGVETHDDAPGTAAPGASSEHR